MEKNTNDDITFKVYIISAKRYVRGMITAKNFTDYVHVVRESEKDAYIEHGFDNVISFPDDDINRYSKVFNYLVDNAKEDVIAIVDDDIDYFQYRNPFSKKIKDPEIVQAEFERLAQMIYDLNLGLAFGTPNASPYMYTGEFSWSGIPGAWKIVNRKVIKAKMDSTVYRNVDIDYVLQELLSNRICLCARYLCAMGKKDKITNSTGSIYSKKNIENSIDKMKIKWGRHFQYDEKRNVPKILVKR